MKTTFQLLVSTLTTAFIMAACGNSGSTEENKSPGEIEAINKEASFHDSLQARQTVKFNFENLETAKLLEDWSQYFTGSGGTDWQVLEEEGNKVLGQLYSDNPSNHFNIIVNDSITAKNMILNVRLKGKAGRIDQGGGFIWRFRDKNNYYVVRANPLEDNVVLYKVEDGKRTDLPLIGKGKTYGVDVEKLGDSWNTLKLVVKDSLFTVYLNDEELFMVKDQTFSNAGKTGLWTKADAVTYFDDFEIIQYE